MYICYMYTDIGIILVPSWGFGSLFCFFLANLQPERTRTKKKRRDVICCHTKNCVFFPEVPGCLREITLPETISECTPETLGLEDEFPFRKAYFQGLCLVSGRVGL